MTASTLFCEPDSARHTRLACELAQFERRAAARRIGKVRVEAVDDHAFVIRPDACEDDRIDLLLLSLVHGDEVAGIFVLNALCSLIDSSVLSPSISIGMAACNIAAARRGMRYLERDLNRSFGRNATDSLEDRRARQLEALMRRSSFCVDLHQTIEPTHTPFYVFDHEPASLRLAHTLQPRLPVVTHWGPPFSTTRDNGCTGYEQLHRLGCVGFGIELGEKGDSVQQVALGVDLCLRAMAVVQGVTRENRPLAPLSAVRNAVFTWSEVVPYPDTHVRLHPGLANFQPISAGQELGTTAHGAVHAAKEGYLIFPKYVHSEHDPRPPELYRLLRRVHLAELGRGDSLVTAPKHIT